jgi:signal peptidase I
MPSSDAARPSRVRRVFRFARNCLAVIGALFVVYHSCFELSEMLSPSMSPTLRGAEKGTDNDWILTERISYWFRNPRRFEVVRFRNNDGIDVMKRVGGLPGEHVSSRDNWLLIGGQPIARPAELAFLKYYPYGRFFKGDGSTNGPDAYFVLGDDSMDSQDSRYDGAVERSRLRGRAWLRVWPPVRIGFIH